ncbi:5-(carboxyamino)imidazole ribonucleotide synthase [Puniceicoccales bacterium CK1056]|uniref:N5-carboxyaminoimidazole ribonucleotide synthase n=1 Tax=Oceanipulchritudo coccoides TaxID=2706888 RepID=A0A6B2M0V8_9BACT|nr:5-(carboxyamino)imidazole ribonucleotide synthase [Oceanipulchritudo coccoides]NDV61415.1 5-(carboxyamino)imidazole ribonucleotide synthase [Oceanipulchritudo coccoides]
MKTLLPGSTIGMLGGGQLGRMSILAGRKLGYRFIVLEPSSHSAAGMVADQQVEAAYDDPDGLRAFAGQVDRATLEFENIPARSLEILAESVEVFPGRLALEVCQNRGREKQFLKDNKIPCAPFAIVRSLPELEEAIGRIGLPAVLKTADFGYDGKGQVRIDPGMDLAQVWSAYEGHAAVLEGWVEFSGEYSVICGRNAEGQSCVYPLIHNTHRNHILFTSVSPAGVSAVLEKQAQELALSIADGLDLVGLVAVELFLTGNGWVVNEMAPRPHNSGHLTFDSHMTSQFEQHIRLVCGLAPGSAQQHTPACMLNVLGDVWKNGPPDWAGILEDPQAKLHLYDKGEPRPGRKMGHITFLGDNPEDCLARAIECDKRLYEAIR